jgi:hypothetical protein
VKTAGIASKLVSYQKLKCRQRVTQRHMLSKYQAHAAEKVFFLKRNACQASRQAFCYRV